MVRVRQCAACLCRAANFIWGAGEYMPRRMYLMLLALPLLNGCAEIFREGEMIANQVVDNAMIRAQLSGSAVVSQAFIRADLFRANLMSDVTRQRESLEATM